MRSMELVSKRYGSRGSAAAIVIILIVIVAVVAGLILVKRSAGAGVPAALKVIPVRCSLIGHFDVSRALTVDAVRDELDKPPAEQNENFKKLLSSMKKAGLEPDDVSGVWLGLDTSSTSENEEPEGMIVINTKKEMTEQVLDAMIEAGDEEEMKDAQKTEVAGLKAVESKDSLTVLLDSQTLITGDPRTARDAVDLAQGTGGENVAGNAKLMGVARPAERKSMVWVAAVLSEDVRKKLAEKGNSPQNPVDLGAIKSLVVTADYTKGRGTDLSVEAEMTSETKAQDTSGKLMQMVKPMAMMMLGMKDEDITSEVKGSVLTLSVLVSDELADQLKQMSRQGVGGPGGGMGAPGGGTGVPPGGGGKQPQPGPR